MNTKDYTKGERLYGDIKDSELGYMPDDIAEQFEKEEKEAFKREEYRQEQEEAEEAAERERMRNDAIFHAMKELDGKL